MPIDPKQIAFVGPTYAAPGYAFAATYRASPPALVDGVGAYLLTDSIGQGRVTEVDGANVTLGSKADAASAAVGGTAMSVLRQLHTDLTAAAPASQAGPSLGPAAALGVVQQDGQTFTLTANSAAALTNATYTTGAIPIGGSTSASLALTSIGSGNTWQFEQSNDGVNWYATPAYASGNLGSGPPNVQGNGQTTYLLPLVGVYLRLRVVVYGSGTVTAIVTLKVTNLAAVATYATLAGTPGVTAYSSVSSNAGGMTTVSRVVSAAATTNATLVKTAAGRLYKITGYNAAGALRWLKFYNKSSAPVPGTDTPFFQLPLPPGVFSFDAQDIGYYFGTGIGYAITTGAPDNDANPVTLADILNLNVWYL